MIRVSQLKMPIKHSEKDLKEELLRQMKIGPDKLAGYEIIKRSLDARKREGIHYTYTLDVRLKEGFDAVYLKRNRNKNIAQSTAEEYRFAPTGSMLLRKRPVVCGSGPAGMFCAYFLAKHGFAPIVLERGEPVEKRMETVKAFWSGKALNTESNVQFGEGGAGTFSDGKLNTMVKDTHGRIREVLKTFVRFGAPEEILYANRPHIGTDYLCGVVAGLRKEIVRSGGEFMFCSRMEDLILSHGALAGVLVRTPEGEQSIDVEVLVAAVGHSARDTFRMLYRNGLKMEAKAFAIGARVEHKQELINRNQYKDAAPFLPAADYRLSHAAKTGRGVYSFCMCPGGFVVNASSEPGRLAVNGMSYHARAGENANSALIVTVTPEDFRNYKTGELCGADIPDGPSWKADPLSGILFQQHYEALAYRAGKGKIPFQLYGDLKEGKKSTGFGRISPNRKGEGAPADLRECLPDYVIQSLLEGMEAFERPIPGFADPEAVFSGVETRTSSPVRLLRGESMESSIAGVYPCGEGAGYAGGITSAAVDGIKVFEAIASKYSGIGEM